MVWLSWIDDCMVWGPQEVIGKESKEFTSRFDCDEVGEVKEYVGCKVDHDKKLRQIKLLNPSCCRATRMSMQSSTRSRVPQRRRERYW